MPLTPLDIEQKTFRVALRGYAEDEVDAFLDEIVASIREYEQRLNEAMERIRVLEEQLEVNQESEERLKKTLMIAQRTADDVIRDARAEAQQIIADARYQAAELEAERVRVRGDLEADIATYRGAQQDLKGAVKTALERIFGQLEELDEEVQELVPADLGVDETEEAEVAGGDEGEDEAADETPYGSEIVEDLTGEESEDLTGVSDSGVHEAPGEAYLGGAERRPWERYD